jgi:hypothetical protein
MAFLAGAVEKWRLQTAEPLTAHELERILARCPGWAAADGGVANPSAFGFNHEIILNDPDEN